MRSLPASTSSRKEEVASTSRLRPECPRKSRKDMHTDGGIEEGGIEKVGGV
jgi:hypothetical protein